MFIDRGSGGSGTHLEWRIRFAGAGILLALIGIYTDSRWLVWIALALLVSGFLLRFLPSQQGGPDDEDSSD